MQCNLCLGPPEWEANGVWYVEAWLWCLDPYSQESIESHILRHLSPTSNCFISCNSLVMITCIPFLTSSIVAVKLPILILSFAIKDWDTCPPQDICLIQI